MLRFARATVDLAGRTVTRDGTPRHLEPQAFDLLAYLISHRDRVVPKEELLDEVWGDQFVSESALTTRIKEIRRALGDDGATQQVVRTVRGRGYRFVAALDEPTSHRGRPVAGVRRAATVHGREEAVAEVTLLTRRAPVVTLTGPGGVGKTTLALEAAGRVAEGCEQGVIVVPLAALSEPDEVVHVLRRSTGLADAGPDEADLVGAIADLDAVLVVDNCEHVITEAARWIDAIAAAGGPVRVLATSRERLGIRSELVHPVPPLDPESARALLTDRARALQPGWEGDPVDVDRLVELVDRLPLAIEMAAARLPSTSVAELTELLEVRLDLLRSGERDPEQRHTTLQALVEWSQRLVDPVAWALLVDLSVFAGPVGASDIAAVVEADPAELATGPLADLVEHSLVVADTTHTPTRYHLLETVRACVADRREQAIDRRHAAHVAAVVRDADRALRTPLEADAAHRIDELAAEIRAAHRWARDHDPATAADLTRSLLHHAHERQWTEPAAWARALLETASGDEDDEIGARAAAALAADASNRGDYDQARVLAARAAGSADPHVVAFAHNTLADVGIYVGDTATALHHGGELRALADATADPIIWTLSMLGDVLALLYAERIDEARARLDERRPPSPLSPTSTAWLAYAEGEVLAAEGRPDEAIEWFQRAITTGRAVDSRFVVSVAEVSALATRSRHGEIGPALAAFRPVLDQYQRTRSLTHATTALRNLIVLLVRAGHDEPSMVLLGALSGPEVKATYGTESALLVAAERSVRDRNPTDAVDDWLRQGAAHDAVWALGRAIEVLDELASSPPVRSAT